MGKLVDLTGQVINNWKIIEKGPSASDGHARWWAECLICYEKSLVLGKHIRSGASTKCKKCSNKEKRLDLTGQTINGWKIIKPGPNIKEKTAWYTICPVCKKEYLVTTNNLIEGHQKCKECFEKQLINDFTGQTINGWKIIERAPNKGRTTMWKAICPLCKKEKIIATTTISQGNTKGCLDCTRLRGEKHANFSNLVGQRFGLLKVDSLAYFKEGQAYWNCICECGNSKIIYTHALKKVISCGCKKMSKGEIKIRNILQENNIDFLFDTPYFKDLKTSENGIGRFDFIIFDRNKKPFRLIEFDGKQHYEDTGWHSLEIVQLYDEIKNKYALEHNIPLVRIPYTEIDNINYDMLMSNKYLLKEAAHV